MSISSSNQDAAASPSGGGFLRVLPAPAMDPEAVLIARAQGGDRAAMHELLAPWNDRIFSFLLTLLRNRADAEDAAQETFLRVVRGLPGYEHTGQFQAWIYRIARNQAALTAGKVKRQQTRESAVEPEALNDFPSTTDDDAVRDQEERASQLFAAVESLPLAEREVVLLRINEDLKFKDIADRTGAPLNTVLGRMRNATERLRTLLRYLDQP